MLQFYHSSKILFLKEVVKLTIRKMLRWVIPTLWLAFIIFLSCQTGSSSGKLSAWFTKLLFSAVAPKAAHCLLRLFAHFIIHFILSVLIYQAARYEVINPASLTIICGFSVAICDELIQLFVDGRAFELSDITFNIAGIFIGIVLCVLLTSKQKTALS